MVSDLVRLRVNGREVSLDAHPQTPLIMALRNDLGLRGVRTGCAIGECGVCTVVVDGVPTKSCSTPLIEVESCDVVTPEGLGTPDNPHPVQQAFLDEQAGQCGYCINGMIMTVAALQDKGARSEAELRDALDAHLCRCATHVRILAAGRRALGIDDWDAQHGPSQDDSAMLADVAVAKSLQDDPAAADRQDVPAAIRAYPRVESWLAITEEGKVEVRTGKVEIGQGIRTAMAQIAAAQLGIAAEQVDSCAPGTTSAPDEGFTAGSNSVDGGGAAVAMAATALRRLVLERAALRFECDTSDLTIGPRGEVVGPGSARVTFAELVVDGPLEGEITESDRCDWGRSPLGEPRRRDDLISKLTGAPAFVHDLALDNMLHARVLLPPVYDAALRSTDLRAVEAMPGVVQVLADGRLLVVVAEREDQAVRALSRLEQETNWDDRTLASAGKAPESFRSLKSEPHVARLDDVAARDDYRQLTATYWQPYQAHASVAPSCAVAVVDGSVTRIWSHTQGVYPLQRELAAVLREEPERVEVMHGDGPGCYGQNLADDAAAFAAVAARAVQGRPVRFQFMVEDEFTWDPLGSAMLADLNASLTPEGRIATWRHHTLTDVHSTRPNGDGRSLILPWLRAEGAEPQWPGPTEGGARNIVPPYEVEFIDAKAEHVRGPLRVGALRSLGAFFNVFAAESFMDELAEAAGKDPLEFRLDHLRDERARRVLSAAARAIGWQPHVGPSGRGIGLAVARYKSMKAYVAQAIEIAVDPADGTIEPRRVVVACDAGAVINRDGLVNQLEGGTLQGLSRVLHERMRVTDQGMQSRDWTTYPILRFWQVPQIETIVLSPPGAPPLGAGEAATPPVAAAVANAIDDAIGIRLREVPLTPKSLEERLLTMSDEEARRVLIA